MSLCGKDRKLFIYDQARYDLALGGIAEGLSWRAMLRAIKRSQDTFYEFDIKLSEYWYNELNRLA